MKKQLLRFSTLCLLAILGITQKAQAADFKDFSVIVNNQTGTLLTSEEQVQGTAVSFGVAVDGEGTVSRVAVDDASSVATISGTYHSDHGCTGLKVVVPVTGNVKITVGQCTFSTNTITVKNSNNETVASKTPSSPACWKNNRSNVDELFYSGGATTLTISGMGYCPYIAVEAVAAAPTKYNITYSLGGESAIGILPASAEVTDGDTYTLPKNFTLYKEGYTLTGWNDGTNTYNPGQVVTPTGDMALTPVFTANTVSLADRTAEVTLNYTFCRNQGAPTVAYQNTTGIWVAQATIGDKVIDVKADFDTNNGGKFANGNWTDWAQLNQNTKWTIPSCKGATVSIEAYNELSTTSIDGQTDYTSGKTISYTVASAAETVDVVIGNDGSYYRYIKVVLPVVQSAGGESYDNADATITWPLLTSEGAFDASSHAETPDGAFSVVSFEHNATTTDVQVRSKDPDNGMRFATFRGDNVQLHWSVKPAKGLTFTPTQIKMNIQRFGTNKKDGVVITAKVGEGEVQTLGTFTARRANWDDDQEMGQWGEIPSNLTNEAVIDLTAEQQAALASGEGFDLYATTSLANNKDGGFANIRIYGKVNGTKASVEMYTLAIAASPEEGGSVSAYPKADEYEAGSEVTLTATENFGYDFVNWKNAAGEEVSTEAKFKYTVNANETLTANFKKVNTYELALTVDGTNDYMVTVDPAPDEVDGKWMYEEGTKVVLTANQYEGLVTFTNWSDNSTNSELTVTMDANKQITASYSETDIIAGWDFYKKGSEGRKADFAGEDNDADALNLVETETGNTGGWLDKSTLGGGGYESFKGAAVNWQKGSDNGIVGNWHWQTKVNAEAFTDVNVQFQMLYNYNAYQTYDAEYSLDGNEWTKFGSITMEGPKQVASFNQKLPEAANNQANLYIRMKADKTSLLDGAVSANDGNTLAMFFITGSPKLVDDPVAPTLASSVPENNATGASASGKIVLNFDKKVQVAEGAKGTLVITGGVGGQELTPAVSGKVITFDYKGLDYAKSYTFTLPANSVQNLTGTALADAITINFTTMDRPTVTKGAYDAVVENVDQLMAAINAAENRSDKNVRFRIFIKNGEYTIPLSSTMKTCNDYEVPECITFLKSGNISFIGESRDGVIITNGIDKNETFAGTYGTTSKYDGIGNSDVFQISGSGYYWQDVTIETGMDDATGRDLAIHDKATKTIYKNVGLRGYQDTWTSNNDNGLYYFEDGYVRGRTDYMCGKGDAYFNGVELRQIAGGYAAVPSKPAAIGWVYKDCVINGEPSVVNYASQEKKSAADADGNYTLGRPWGSGTPVAVFIDTKMNVVPSAIGWNEMSNGWPKRFAEYNSTTSTGSVIDLSGRKTTFGEGHANNPILTAEEAAEYSDMSKMFGDWQPTLATEQAPVPTGLNANGNKLTWDDSDYALLWAVCKDGEIVDFTTEPTYTITEEGLYSVRAANEMGGLSAESASIVLQRNITAGNWSTIVVPFAMTADQVTETFGSGAKVAELTSGDAATLNFTTVTAMKANQPYAIKVASDFTAAAISGVKIAKATSTQTVGDWQFIGTYTAGSIPQNSYYFSENKLKKATGTTSTIKPFRAYLTYTGTSSAPSITFTVDGEATGIESIANSQEPMANSQYYNLAGQRIANGQKPTAKGLYIVNGRKVVIK